MERAAGEVGRRHMQTMSGLGFSLQEVSLGITACAQPKTVCGAELCIHAKASGPTLNRIQERWARGALGVCGPIPRALLLRHVGWPMRLSTLIEERAIRLYCRAQVEPRYAEAKAVLALAQDAAGTWTHHVRQLMVRWGVPEPPGPATGPAAAIRFRRLVRAAARGQDRAWLAEPAQREALQRPAGTGATAADLSAQGATLPEVRAWARLALQGALLRDATGAVAACRFCGASLETWAHLE
eukprot:746326-Pyramimonas_sp.AAC.1